MVAGTKDSALKERVQMLFTTGSRLVPKDIKTTLDQIYSDLSIKRKAKATDIFEWFEVKTVKVSVPGENKRINGFELISLK